MQQSKVLDYYLTNDPLKRVLTNEDRARFLSLTQVHHYGIDDVIYQPKNPARYLFFIVEGTVTLHLDDHKSIQLNPGDYFGEESVLKADFYGFRATSRAPTTVISFPLENFLNDMDRNLELRSFFMASYVQKTTPHSHGPSVKKTGKRTKNVALEPVHPHHTSQKNAADSDKDSPPTLGFCAAWILAIMLPILTYYLTDTLIDDANGRLYFSILMGAIALWIFKILPPYVPGIFMIVTSLSLSILPSKTILSGFSSGPLVMVLCFFIVGSVIISSGLFYRFMVLILKYVPPSPFWLNASVFFLGTLLSTILPSPQKRAVVFAHFFSDFSRNTGWSPSSKSTQKLMMTAYNSVTLLGPVFLSGTVYGFLLYALLTPQDQDRFQWLGWFTSAFFPMVLLILCSFVLHFFILPETEKPQIDRERIEGQLKALGPLSGIEKASILAFILIIISVVAAPLHHISPTAIMLGVVFILMIFNYVQTKPLNVHVDWSALVTLGTVLCLVGALKNLGLMGLIFQFLQPAATLMENQLMLFVALLILIGTILRLWISDGVFTALSLILFVPLAAEKNINPWVIGWIILMIGESWFNPKSYPAFQSFFGKNDLGANESKEWDPVQLNAIMTILKWGVIFASFPYWKTIGLL